MTGWIVLGAVLLLLSFVLFVPVSVQIQYDEQVRVSLRVLLFRLRLYPIKQKLKLRHFRIQYLRRLAAKRNAQRTKLRKKGKRKSKALKDEAKKSQKDATLNAAMLRLLIRLTRAALGHLGRYMKIHIRECTIRLAAGDAAHTAIAYGVASAALNQFWQALCEIGAVKYRTKKNIHLIADFSGRPADFHCNIVASSNVLRVLLLSLRAVYYYQKEQKRIQAGENSAQRLRREQNEAEARRKILDDLS